MGLNAFFKSLVIPIMVLLRMLISMGVRVLLGVTESPSTEDPSIISSRAKAMDISK